MKDKNRKTAAKSLHWLLTREYLVFFFLVAGMAVLVWGMAVILESYAGASTGVSKLTAQMDTIRNEEYQNVRVGRFLGKGGYFEILDEDANVLYSSLGTVSNHYTKDLLQYVDDVGKTFFDIQPYTDEDGQPGYVIYKYDETEETNSAGSDILTDSDVENLDGNLRGIIVLDGKKNILYSNLDITSNRVTKKELGILYNNAKDLTYMMKKSFRTEAGERRYLLIHMEGYRRYEASLHRRIRSVLIAMYLGLVMILTIWFGWKISRSVNKPLSLLKIAMQSCQKDDAHPGDQIVYTGPVEFEEIVDSYNHLEKRLEESRQKQQELEEQKKKMLADISHDLKTPVTVIQAYATAIDEGLVKEEDIRRYLRTIRSRADLLTDLVNQFTEYSNLDHPEFHLTRNRDDICEYLREYFAEKYEELDLAGYPVRVDLPEQRIFLDFDKAQMRRVFENILSNAVRYNPPGTEIFAALTESADEVRIRIGDSGKGIPPALRDRIFEPFIVGDASRTSGQGSGLGLSIAKKIIELHGSTIALDAGDQGTVYCICLPKK